MQCCLEKDFNETFVSFRMEHSVPLSYEQALAMGRTGRILGSPVLNGGYKSKGLHARHSDSDEEDWC